MVTIITFLCIGCTFLHVRFPLYTLVFQKVQLQRVSVLAVLENKIVFKRYWVDIRAQQELVH